LGRHQVYELREKFAVEAADLPEPCYLSPFFAAVELFYPCNRRGADGPLEPCFDGEEDEIIDELDGRLVEI
jgi:hypothetical protein